jgi:protein-tyrosine phosphatase
VTDNRHGSLSVHPIATCRSHRPRTVGVVPSTLAPDRSIDLAGAFNFRDLGGYETADGRSVRWRQLFRSDSLDSLTATDLDSLQSLGLNSVIDLRSAPEIERNGRFPVETASVAWHHLSVVDTTWERDESLPKDLGATEFLELAYNKMLTEGATRFAHAFALLADADALPAVFHCAAGKDRTGLLAALVLGAIGVHSDAIVADFALTEAAMPRFIEAMKVRYPERFTSTHPVPAGYMAATPEAMERTLNRLTNDHGSIRNYVRHIGVTNDAVERLESALLTPAG